MASATALSGQQMISEMDKKLSQPFEAEKVLESDMYKISTTTLKDDRFNDNVLYTNLLNRLQTFYILAEKYRLQGPTKRQLQEFKDTGFNFDFRMQLHKCLKKLMLSVVTQREKIVAEVYLKEVYAWFIKRLSAMNALSKEEQKKEARLLNTTVDAMATSMKQIVRQKLQSSLVNEDEQREAYKAMFVVPQYGSAQRTEHPAIAPASVRIKDVQVKRCGKSGQLDKAISDIKKKDDDLYKARLYREQNQEGYKRGIATASIGSVYDVHPSMADKSTKAGSSAVGSEDFEFQIAKGEPLPNYLDEHKKFERSEKATKNLPFKTFWTTNLTEEEVQPVRFTQQNRFEGRSNYFHYYPTNTVTEQKLEKVWFDSKNRQLQEKRRDEETKQILNEWAAARGRMEAEIQRKKEHIQVATNFEKARGFVRSNWKSKNFNPNDDPTKYDSSTDESEIDRQEQAEMKDRVEDFNQTPMKQFSRTMTQSAKPMARVVDIGSETDFSAYKPNAATQFATLKAIQEYNKALPKAKKGKDSLPDINVSNIQGSYLEYTDPKKGDKELVTKYNMVGIQDSAGVGFASPNVNSFSLGAKQASIQKSASAKRISHLRKHFGDLIGPATPSKPPGTAGGMGIGLVTQPTTGGFDLNSADAGDIDNPFTEETLHRDISLSCYSSPQKCLDRRVRPMTTPDQLLKRVPGWKPQKKKGEEAEEGEVVVPVEGAPREPVLPELKDVTEKMTKDATEQYRQEALNEVYSIKDCLARSGQPSNMKVIQKAILMPEELQLNPSLFKYPDISELIMKDPSPKAKKKGKKGKKKK